jgi:3HB-oligomer hydrolase (3HBOH)
MHYPGFDTIYIPLHRYFIEAMDLMYEHLRHGRVLPPSQVVHTVPRVGTPGTPRKLRLQMSRRSQTRRRQMC